MNYNFLSTDSRYARPAPKPAAKRVTLTLTYFNASRVYNVDRDPKVIASRIREFASIMRVSPLAIDYEIV